MQRAAHLTLTFGLLLAPAILGCVPQEPAFEGMPIGEYTISGVLDANGCGERAVPASESFDFEVELAHALERAEWRRLGAPTVIGLIRPNGSWRFRSSVVLPVFDADPQLGRGGCALEQVETITLDDVPTIMDGGLAEPEDELEGESRIQYVPTPSSDCSPSVAVFGGPFFALPCEVRYDLVGTLINES